ncbi:hypothetical protein WDU94_003426 [Cyamophila willieti]
MPSREDVYGASIGPGAADTISSRGSSSPSKCKKYVRKFFKHLFSNLGLFGLVVGYVFIGAVVFEYLESKNEIDQRIVIQTKRDECVKELWHITDEDDNEDHDHEKIKSFKFKEIQQNRLRKKLEEKSLHGQYLKRVNNIEHSVPQTFSWLRRGQLKPATEATIVAAQDQALRTRNYEKYILKTKIDDDRCRICQEKSETIDHILSACPQLAKHEYILRHNKICTYVHWCLCKKYNIPGIATRWYEHEPKPVVNNEEVTILYDTQIHTDRTVPANKPDIVIKNLKEKHCTLIDISVPCDKNLISKEAEKKLKYRTLAIEVSKMWNLKTLIVPVIIGALGTIPQTLHNNIKTLEGNISIHKIQDIALCGSANILRKTIY